MHDFLGYSYNYNVVAQGSAYGISVGGVPIVVQSGSDKCRLAPQGSAAGRGSAGAAVAFNIGSGLQWTSGSRLCSFPKLGGPIIVKVSTTKLRDSLLCTCAHAEMM